MPAAGEVKPTPPAAPAPAAAAPAPAPAPAATPAATPQPQPAAVETPEAIAAREKATREAAEAQTKKVFEELQKQYALPDDLLARLPTEPEAVLPYMFARVHQHVVGQVQQMMAQVLPQQIHAVMEHSRANNEAKDAFYKAWPSLDPQKHHAYVMEVGALFRRMNPQASAQEAIERIGKVVHEALGIPLTAVAAAAPAAAAPAPFRPAGGAGSGRAAPAPGDNEFAQLANELLLEDAG